jgi:hypothetical protein
VRLTASGPALNSRWKAGLTLNDHSAIFFSESDETMNELIVIVENAPEGGLTARALGASIFTEADTVQSLHEQVRDAVRCHFENGEGPASFGCILSGKKLFRHEIAARPVGPRPRSRA